MRYPVALTQCTSYEPDMVAIAIARQFNLLGPIDSLIKPGDRVLIKPNMISPKSPDRPVQTHPAVILACARRLKDLGAHPIVGDSPAWGSVFSCAEALQLTQPLQHLGVPLRALNKPIYQRIGSSGTRVGISSVLQEVDAIINLPKLKMHCQIVGTFAIKNMFGCVCGKWKPYFHYAKGTSIDQFSTFLIELYDTIAPVLTLIDAVEAMEGSGPVNGTSRHLGWIIGSRDGIACERMCAKLIHIAPERFPIINTARSMHYGCPTSDAIDLLGDTPDFNLSPTFDIPAQTPIRFSLRRIIKSVAKGLLSRRSTG
jgi:uncharacterized protein (DUF362 family)